MDGCEGGEAWGYWNFSHDHGSMLDADYPYKGKDKKCKHQDDLVVAHAGDRHQIKGDVVDVK